MPLPRNIPEAGTQKVSMPSLPDLDSKKQVKPIEREEDVFTQLDPREVELEDLRDEEIDDETTMEIEEEIYRERSTNNNTRRNPVPQMVEFDDPFEEGTYEEDDDDEFIDKKKKKIKPFGEESKESQKRKAKKGKGKGKGKKKKKTSIKAKDFDDRKNDLTMIKIQRTVVMAAIVGLMGMGIKNTFFPSHVYTQDDIAAIAQQAVGQTGFPMNRGRAFAEQFTTAYFEMNTEDANSKKVMESFYGGSKQSAGKAGTVSSNGKTVQKVLAPPKVFYEGSAGSNVGFYHVSTLVSDRDAKTFGDDGTMNAKWVALAVTVYYNDKTQELSVAPDSPQLIPSYQVGEQGMGLPQEEVLGTGVPNTDLYPSMAPTINGFLKAYGKSSAKSHAEIDQYIKEGSDPGLYSGFAGKYYLNDEELTSSNTAIYPSSSEEGNNEYKVSMNLKWHDAASDDPRNDLVYAGRYVMTLEKGKDGKFFVTKFRPYTYSPKAEVPQE